MGLPKVKRDKFSVFNFLTVTESREAAGNFIHTQEALKSPNRLSHSSGIFCKRTLSPFSCFFNLKACLNPCCLYCHLQHPPVIMLGIILNIKDVPRCAEREDHTFSINFSLLGLFLSAARAAVSAQSS